MKHTSLNLKNELQKMLAANGNLKSAIAAFNDNSRPDEQLGMIGLVIASLHDPSEADFWERGVKINIHLLEILRNLKSAGCDEVGKPLENYCSRIHKLENIRDQKGDLLEEVKQHLMYDVGKTLEVCKRRSYPTTQKSATHWSNNQ